MNELQFRILRTEDDIEPFLDEWKQVAAHPLAHPEVVRALARNDTSIVELFIPMLVDGQGRIACMFSSRVEHAHLGRDVYLPLPKRRIRKLTIPTDGIVGRSAPEHVGTLLRMTLDAIKHEKVDVLELPNMGKDDPVLRALEKTDLKAFHSGHRHSEEHWTMEIAEDFDQQMLLLGRSTRSTTRNTLNKFERMYEGRHEIRTFTDVDDVENALKTCQSIDDCSYHRALGVNLECDSRTLSIYEGLAKQGGLEINILYIDGNPVAFINNSTMNETRFGTHMGNNTEFCRHPLGTILLFKTIKRYIDTGKRQTFDFGIGGAEYKSRLCTSMRMTEQRDIRMPRALINPNYLYMLWTHRLGLAIKKLLAKVNLEEEVRRRMRRHHHRREKKRPTLRAYATQQRCDAPSSSHEQQKKSSREPIQASRESHAEDATKIGRSRPIPASLRPNDRAALPADD